MGEEELLQLFISGDHLAFTSIYNKYVNELYAYGIGLGFNPETIKDAIQEIFYKIYFNRDLLKGVINLKYYLFRSLKNKLLDVFRSSVPTHEISESEPDFTITVTILDELIDLEEKATLKNRVEKLLDRLTNRQREAVYLRFMQEMSYDEIAELLKMTPQATRKLIFRAMERMREQNLIFFLFI